MRTATEPKEQIAGEIQALQTATEPKEQIAGEIQELQTATEPKEQIGGEIQELQAATQASLKNHMDPRGRARTTSSNGKNKMNDFDVKAYQAARAQRVLRASRLDLFSAKYRQAIEDSPSQTSDEVTAEQLVGELQALLS